MKGGLYQKNIILNRAAKTWALEEVEKREGKIQEASNQAPWAHNHQKKSGPLGLLIGKRGQVFLRLQERGEGKGEVQVNAGRAGGGGGGHRTTKRTKTAEGLGGICTTYLSITG